jgi:hypothetical protein
LPDYPEYAEEVAVFGSASRLQLQMPGPYLPAHRATLHVEALDGDERAEATYRGSHRTGFVQELAAFADALQYGGPGVSPPSYEPPKAC